MCQFFQRRFLFFFFLPSVLHFVHSLLSHTQSHAHSHALSQTRTHTDMEEFGADKLTVSTVLISRVHVCVLVFFVVQTVRHTNACIHNTHKHDNSHGLSKSMEIFYLRLNHSPFHIVQHNSVFRSNVFSLRAIFSFTRIL